MKNTLKVCLIERLSWRALSILCRTLHNVSVLIVDDDKEQLRDLGRILETEGFNVDVAESYEKETSKIERGECSIFSRALDIFYARAYCIG